MSNELECKRCHLTKSKDEFKQNDNGTYVKICNYCREQHNYACKKYLADQRKIKQEDQEKYNELHKEDIGKKKKEKELLLKLSIFMLQLLIGLGCINSKMDSMKNVLKYFILQHIKT